MEKTAELLPKEIALPAICIFSNTVTGEMLNAYRESTEPMKGTFFDLDDAECRSFVKGKSKEIKAVISALDTERKRLKSTYESSLKAEFDLLVSTLEGYNLVYTGSIDAYAEKRKQILADEKAAKLKEDAENLRIESWEAAISFNELHDLKKREADIKAREDEQQRQADAKEAGEKIAAKKIADDKIESDRLIKKAAQDLEDSKAEALRLSNLANQKVIDDAITAKRLADQVEQDKKDAETKRLKDIEDAETKRLNDIAIADKKRIDDIAAAEKAVTDKAAADLLYEQQQQAIRKSNNDFFVAVMSPAKQAFIAAGLSVDDATKACIAVNDGKIPRFSIDWSK